MQESVLITPLYWGIGHATRMIPLALALQESGHKVLIAAPKPLLNLFDTPDIVKIEFGSYRVRYPNSIPLVPALLFQSPLLFFQAIIDRLRIGRIIRKHNITTLINDNRFGCRSSSVRSIYVSHQVNIASVFNPTRRSRLLSAIHRMIINSYDECWVPDNPPPDNIAGFLSDPTRLRCNYRYIGTLSRIALASSSPPPGFTPGNFFLLILSGPEPAKSRFGEVVESLFRENKLKLIVAKQMGPENLRYLIENCEGVICRSGYSTIMDLFALDRGALLVPTPGQSEQLYLAEYLSSGSLFNSVAQKDLSLNDIIGLSGIKNHNKDKGDKPRKKTGINLRGRVDLQV